MKLVTVQFSLPVRVIIHSIGKQTPCSTLSSEDKETFTSQ